MRHASIIQQHRMKHKRKQWIETLVERSLCVYMQKPVKLLLNELILMLAGKEFLKNVYFFSYTDCKQPVCKLTDSSLPARWTSECKLSGESHSEHGSVVSLLRTVTGS